MSAEEYIFEKVSPERLKDIQYLYKGSFGEDVSMEFLQRKYDTSKLGAYSIGYIAYHTGGEPAAYYGVFPCKAVIAGETILCAQSGDTMTHPNHRGKGLFIKLAKASYELAKEMGIKFVFGFPNENSYHGFVNKLSWVHTENLNIYKFRVHTIPLAYICSKVSFLGGIYKAYASWVISQKKCSKKFFVNPLIDETSGGVLRDEMYFEYKDYFKKDIIEINGKCVYIKAANALRVGDIESCTEEEFLQIVNKLQWLAWRLGCYAVYFYYSPGTKYGEYLSKKAQSEKGLAIGWVDLGSGKDLSKLKFSQADLDTF